MLPRVLPPCVPGIPGGGVVSRGPLHLFRLKQYGRPVRVSQDPAVHRKRERHSRDEGFGTRGKILDLFSVDVIP